MALIVYALIGVIGISLISFIGVLSLSFRHQEFQAFLQHIISFATGALLGNVFLHLLPKAFALYSAPLFIGFCVLTGIFMFFLGEKMMHWHGHHFHTTVQPLGIMNLVGDALHNFIDGIALATSFLISIPLGISTTLTIVLHEIPQEFSDFGILLHAGFTIRQALWYNFLSAISAVFGTLLVFIVHTHFAASLRFLIPFTAGGFIYIAASNLIPEMHKEKTLHKTFIQSLFFIIGIMLMLGLAFIEKL